MRTPARCTIGAAGIRGDRIPLPVAIGVRLAPGRLSVDFAAPSPTQKVETIRCSSLASVARLPQAFAVSSALTDEAWVRVEICEMLTFTCSVAEFCCEAAVAMRATMFPTSSDMEIISAMDWPDSLVL